MLWMVMESLKCSSYCFSSLQASYNELFVQLCFFIFMSHERAETTLGDDIDSTWIFHESHITYYVYTKYIHLSICIVLLYCIANVVVIIIVIMISFCMLYYVPCRCYITYNVFQFVLCIMQWSLKPTEGLPKCSTIAVRFTNF